MHTKSRTSNNGGGLLRTSDAGGRHIPDVERQGRPLPDEDLVMLETVEENMKMFTKREIERAQAARAAQRQMAHPTDEHFKQIVSQRSLKNLPFSTADIANAKTLLGTSVAGLKGWTTRKLGSRR